MVDSKGKPLKEGGQLWFNYRHRPHSIELGRVTILNLLCLNLNI